jgi:hypothetical protein
MCTMSIVLLARRYKLHLEENACMRATELGEVEREATVMLFLFYFYVIEYHAGKLPGLI